MGLSGESLSGTQIRVVIDLDDQTATYATGKTSAKKGKIIGYVQDSVVPNAPLEESKAITGSRMKTEKVPGNIDVKGQLVWEASYDLLPYFLKLCLGNLESTGTVSPFTHVASPGLDLQTFQMERKLPFATPRYYVYNGCRVDTWSIGFKSSGFATLTMGVSGGKFTDTATEYDSSATDYVANAKLHHQQIVKSSVKLDNVVTAEILDLEISGNNVLVPDDFPMGFGGYRGGNPPGGLMTLGVKGTFRCLSNDAVALLDGGLHTLEFMHEKTTGALSAAWKLFAVQFDRTHPSAAGPGAIRLAFTGEAVLDDGGDLFEVTTINGIDEALEYV